ncbi:MAG TPA: VOC family protein [Candidatus Thermoplasmatota archaeon]|nr:VOC family protein [Candidatus Thermoplasmatota archaeon]
MAKAPRRAKGPRGFPDLGRLDICLDVTSLARSAAFYEALGFREVEGNRSEGWAVLARGGVRVGLFHGFIKSNVLNFRGGDVPAIVRALERAKVEPYEVKFVDRKGAGRASVRDPDGNVIFFDTTPKERAARKRLGKR